MKKLLFFTFVIMVAMGAGKSFAYTVPENDTNVKFLYVTGPDGDPLRGAEDHTITLHIDIPENEQDSVKIGIFDPDTGGDADGRTDESNPWNTDTEITLSGQGGEIYNKKFSDDSNYNNRFYYFESLSNTDGKKVGSSYRFTLDITAVSGDDANLFKVSVSPASAKVSSPNITFRLAEREGENMHFYPLIPAGVDQITVLNYDLDHDGGTASIHDPGNNQDYAVEDSSSGKWHDTTINLDSAKRRYLDYKIIKGTQYWAHAGIQIKDKNGNQIPIYFRKQDMGGCNEFTFDATSSFDPDNQALTYQWDFGDGTTSDQAVVTHQYMDGGEYNVILSVQDSSGLHCDTAVTSQMVTVNTPPICDFNGPDKACTDQAVTFDASGTTDNEQSQLSYEWNFGDGTSGSGPQVTKTYEQGGRYSVSLTVNDNANTSCSTSGCGTTIAINSKPIANAGDDVELCLQHNQEYNVSFDGSRSVDEDNDKLTYRWDFGDGTSSDGASATHFYQNSGEYIATLYIDDQTGTACSSSSDSRLITLNKAPKAIAVSDTNVCQGTPVNFDGSGSIGEEGEVLQYSWDFGDGTTGSGINVTHDYAQGGNYKAVLTVDDMQGTNCSTSIEKVFVTVNARPTAILDAVKVACTGDQISFDTAGTNDPDGDALNYTWDFGDGTSGSGSNPTHSYNKGGNYMVQLEVDDKKGTICSSDMTNINVRINTPPVADAGPNHVCCLQTVSEFDGSQSYDADGDNLTYTWDFGDGATGDGPQVTHVYSTIGKYLVTLNVNDNSGTRCDSATDSFTAVVNATPTSIIQVR